MTATTTPTAPPAIHLDIWKEMGLDASAWHVFGTKTTLSSTSIRLRLRPNSIWTRWFHRPRWQILSQDETVLGSYYSREVAAVVMAILVDHGATLA